MDEQTILRLVSENRLVGLGIGVVMGLWVIGKLDDIIDIEPKEETKSDTDKYTQVLEQFILRQSEIDALLAKVEKLEQIILELEKSTP